MKNKLFILFILLSFTIPIIHVQAQQNLVSDFFSNDQTAKNIISGNNFSIKDDFKKDGTININSFTMKFLSGLIQVGYTMNSTLLPLNEPLPLTLLHKFQSINEIPVTDVISSVELMKLDNMVSNREKLDKQISSDFPLSVALGSPNEPSAIHALALFAISMKSLPPSLVTWSQLGMSEYVKMQGPGGDGGGFNYVENNSSGKVCFFNYFNSLDRNCIPTQKTVVVGLIRDDFSLVYTILHEYAHYLDGMIYSKAGAPTSVATIDTRGFKSISYNTNINCNPKAGSSWDFFKLNDPLNTQDGFITKYAQGNTANGDSSRTCRSSEEDFAESFAMYIMQGNVFRKIAETKPIIAQKYEWLKNNVFSGKEYFTGNADNIQKVSQALSTAGIQELPGFVDYSKIDTNFVWDYSFHSSEVLQQSVNISKDQNTNHLTSNTKVSYDFGTITLRNGSQGPAVKELQRFLNDTMNLGLTLDGRLGPKTIIVIKKWQKDHGLIADGLIGNKTKLIMLNSK